MKFVNVKQFAKMKRCTRQTIYNAECKGKVEIDRSAGIPLVYLTEKNLTWKPGESVGRPLKQPVEL